MEARASHILPDLEKPVRGAARRGQTERVSMETVSMLRVVTHDQGALELRADDPTSRLIQTARPVGVLHSVRGGSAPRNLRLDLSSGSRGILGEYGSAFSCGHFRQAQRMPKMACGWTHEDGERCRRAVITSDQTQLPSGWAVDSHGPRVLCHEHAQVLARVRRSYPYRPDR